MSFMGVGFGYKIAWLAVRDRTHRDIAGALGINVTGQQDWGAAVDFAYAGGWLITPMINSWTLAASTRAFMDEDNEMPQRVEELSRTLGEVQYFGTHRVVDYHAWAHARDGEMVRAFAYLGERGETQCNFGAPSPVERTLGICGLRPRLPDEADVMSVAAAWSMNPQVFESTTMDGMPWVGSAV